VRLPPLPGISRPAFAPVPAPSPPATRLAPLLLARALVALVALAALAACPEVSLEGHRCNNAHPCLDGFVCVDERCLVADGPGEGEGEGEGDAGEGEGEGEGDPFSTDRALFFGAARCPPDVLFCEDFESDAVGQPPDAAVWTTNDERVVVDDAQAARGTQALHVVTRSLEALHFASTNVPFPALERRMFGRLFFYVNPPRPAPFNHWTVVEAVGPTPEGGDGRMRYGGILQPPATNHFLFNYDIWGPQPPGFHEVGAEDQTDIADATWHCIEWVFDVDARSAQFFLDAVEQPAYEAQGSIDGIDLSFPPMAELNIGWAIYQDLGGEEWDVFVDEVAVDDERIGCVR
jgi:hypothetical protein